MSVIEDYSDLFQQARAKQDEVLQECANELRAVLERYNCRLEVEILVTAAGNTPSFKIVHNDILGG